MHFISKRAVVLGVVASLGLAATAHAATDDTSVSLSGGAITLTGPLYGDFAGGTLTGAAMNQTAAVGNWSVNDARGSAAGWEVAMSASELTTGVITMTGAVLSVDASTPSAAVGNDSPAPATLGGNITAGVKVVDADPSEGLGAWTLTQGVDDLALAIPANARAGSYTSTITTTLTEPV